MYKNRVESLIEADDFKKVCSKILVILHIITIVTF